MTGTTPRHGDFTRQLEHVVTAAAFASKLTALETQIAASRACSKAGWLRTRQALLVVKRATIGFALAASFLQYYFLDVNARILAMRPVAVSAFGRA